MLYFVGVGPGDPELLTLKAVQILKMADAIALPDSGKDSVVWKIAGQWMADKPIVRVPVLMKGDRENWEKTHQLAAGQMLKALEKYTVVAYPVLGDPGVYASSSYLMRIIEKHHPCKVIPGIPAMCAAAAELGIPLCEQRENLTVVDHIEGELPGGNVVVMKAGKNPEALRRIAEGRSVYLAKNVGLENAYIGPYAPEKMGGTYFATAIVKDH